MVQPQQVATCSKLAWDITCQHDSLRCDSRFPQAGSELLADQEVNLQLTLTSGRKSDPSMLLPVIHQMLLCQLAVGCSA